MTDPTAPAGNAGSSAQAEEQAIRERVRELTAQMLAGGRLDTEGVKEVVRAMSGGAAIKPPLDSTQAREAFAAAIGGLDQALQSSARAVHEALQALATRGKDFSDNDLKNAFAALQKLQEDYVATANHIADATTGNIRRELVDLTLHAQRVGADASVRIAQVMSEFANRMTGSYRGRAAPGIEAAREYGANVTMLTSGLLAGFADALRQQSESKKAR
jgi:phosphoribosyl-ATP pyrophosphohydrolase